jgi:hypothetical protein
MTLHLVYISKQLPPASTHLKQKPIYLQIYQIISKTPHMWTCQSHQMYPPRRDCKRRNTPSLRCGRHNDTVTRSLVMSLFQKIAKVKELCLLPKDSSLSAVSSAMTHCPLQTTAGNILHPNLYLTTLCLEHSPAAVAARASEPVTYTDFFPKETSSCTWISSLPGPPAQVSELSGSLTLSYHWLCTVIVWSIKCHRSDISN